LVPPTSKPRNKGRCAEATSIIGVCAVMADEYRVLWLAEQRGKSNAGVIIRSLLLISDL
jgi:hypothetical protein